MPFLNYKPLKLYIVIKGVFKRPYYCYGNLLCQENDDNVFTNDWADFSTMIVASSDKQCL